MPDEAASPQTEPGTPPPAPADTTPSTPPRANYHVSIWDDGGPAYVCLLCPQPSPHLSLEDVQTHVQAEHQCAAVPTETIPMLLALRVEADARAAATLPTHAVEVTAADAAPAVPESPEEEPDGGGTDPGGSDAGRADGAGAASGSADAHV